MDNSTHSLAPSTSGALAASATPRTEAATLPEPQHVYLTDKGAVIVGVPQRGWPEESDAAHNCDAMGCGQMHVLYRLPFTDERTEPAEGREAECCVPCAGEPSFVLLARDPQAPALIKAWASDRERAEPESDKPAKAREIAERMRKWKADNPGVGMSAEKLRLAAATGDGARVAELRAQVTRERGRAEVFKEAMHSFEQAARAEQARAERAEARVAELEADARRWAGVYHAGNKLLAAIVSGHQLNIKSGAVLSLMEALHVIDGGQYNEQFPDAAIDQQIAKGGEG